MKAKRKIVDIDEERCTGCGLCASACAEGAIELVNGKAKLVAEKYCDGLAACLGECPEGAIQIVEKEAEAFDPEAVERYLQTTKPETRNANPETHDVLPCGCPSTQAQTLSSAPKEGKSPGGTHTRTSSALTHWPVQIRLVPPAAPFLKNAHLLVSADCTPIAYPGFHNDFLKGRAVLIGCPKFDETEEYINKFADIFRIANIQSVTVLIMEVPCCSKLPVIVRQGMALAEKDVPVAVVVINARGDIITRKE